MKIRFARTVTGLLAATLLLSIGVAPAAAFPPAGSFVVVGKLQQKLLVSTGDVVAHLASLPLPVKTVSVSFQAGTTMQQHTYTGVLLYDLLNSLGPIFDASVNNDKLRFYVSATGSDGYQVIVAWGEIDPQFENKGVLLAFTEDGQSLAAVGPRLVVPGDIRGGRYVTGVVSIRLDRVAPDAIVDLLPLH